MKKIVILVLLCSVAGLAQLARPAVYIEPQNGFETYLAAAISKKNVPVDVVTDQTQRIRRAQVISPAESNFSEADG